MIYFGRSKMNDKKILDERILAERRKIQSRAYAYIIYILLIAVIWQKFFMNTEFAQYSVELFILIACGIYNIIANYIKGIDIWNPVQVSKKQMFLNAVISGIIASLVYAVFSGLHEFYNLAIFFLAYVLFFFVIRYVITFLNKRKQEKINKGLDNDDLSIT